uniref:Uncharacterized protein n=1 Tax=Pithovirus LCPAC102 TaxID=2506587 RepID=A0A4D5XG75_9VIRU|nr:MAG: hypothetical protein LCPAC102_01990 [Pithovirus LCPAC102]
MSNFFGFFSKSDNSTNNNKNNRSSIKRANSDILRPTHINEHIKQNIKNDKILNTYSYLRYQNYDRSLFSYKLLSSIGWWPDEIIKFIEIFRLAYVEFIQSFSNKASIFDTPIRNAIFFMTQRKYSKRSIISKFIKNKSNNIEDNYLNLVIQEDNCYMDEYEDRNRSSTENKHYLLLRAIQELLTLSPIEYEDYKLKKEYEDKLKVFIIIYELKNMYAMIDNILRSSLCTFLECDDEGPTINLTILFDGFINETIDTKLLKYIRSCENNKKKYMKNIFNSSYLFRDLILYGLYKSIQFRDVFDIHISYEKLSEFNEVKYINIFTMTVIHRIEYIYKSFLDKLNYQKTRQQLILNGDTFTELMKNKNINDINIPISPKYTREYQNNDSINNAFPIFTVDDMEKYKTEHINNINNNISNPLLETKIRTSISNEFIPISRSKQHTYSESVNKHNITAKNNNKKNNKTNKRTLSLTENEFKRLNF